MVIWIIISVAALILDIATSGFFFAGITVGGVFAIITLASGGGITTQIVVFSIVSALAIGVEYFWIRTKLKKTIPKTYRMEEQYIGKKVTLDEDINERGKIKLEGIYWTAENIGEPLKKGETAEVISIKGNKLVIKKL